jgi:hypothetical protein
VLKGGTASILTAIEQPLEDDRTTKFANSGIADTLTPLPMSASVTLKSGASNVSWADTPTLTVRMPDIIVPKTLIAVRMCRLRYQVASEADQPFKTNIRCRPCINMRCRTSRFYMDLYRITSPVLEDY